MQNTNPSVAIPITSKRNFNDPDEAIRSFRVQMELDREIDMDWNKKPINLLKPPPIFNLKKVVSVTLRRM